MRLTLLPISLCFFGIFVSCQKNADDLEAAERQDRAARMLAKDQTFSYGSNPLSISETRSENFIKPVIAPDRPGKFVSIPQGLALNEKTGTINLNRSQPGQAYKIFFVEENGVLGDSARIEISGIDYEDAIYALNDNKNSKVANATFNGRNTPRFSSVINLNSFEVEAQDAGSGSLVMNAKTGDIDIEASLQRGAFRKATRNNQRNDDFTIKYRVVERRSRMSNKLTLKVYNFSGSDSVPDEILQIINERKEIMKRVNAMPVGNSSGNGEVGFESDLNAFAKPVRPPLIVIL